MQHHSSRLEVYVISDLHTDYPDNMRWVEELAAARGAGPEGQAGPEVQSALIVAGDISDCLTNIE